MISTAGRQRLLVVMLAVSAMPTGCRRHQEEPGSKPPAEDLFIYVGDSMRIPMEKCIAEYRKRHPDTRLVLDLGDSAAVLTKVKLSGLGEAAVLHEPYPTRSRDEGLGTEVHVLATMRPAIVLRQDNPKTADVNGLMDIDNPNLSLGMTDPGATTSARLIQAALKIAGIHQSVTDRQPDMNKSSGTVCVWVKQGSKDVGLAWDSVARGIPGLRVVRIEDRYMPAEFNDEGVVYHNGNVPVSLVVLKTAKAPRETARFVEFILSPAGQAIWRDNGFNPIAGEPTPPPTTQPD